MLHQLVTIVRQAIKTKAGPDSDTAQAFALSVVIIGGCSHMPTIRMGGQNWSYISKLIVVTHPLLKVVYTDLNISFHLRTKG